MKEKTESHKEKKAPVNNKTEKADIIDEKRIKALRNYCECRDITFNDFSLLDQAFHHRSVTNESKHIKNNERLEFLGDSVLGMVTASYLYTHLENAEGDMAKIKAFVVSEKALAPVALNYGINKLLILGKGEEMTGGRTKPAILADCMEAVIGAYYLDAGYKAAEKYVLKFIIPAVDDVLKNGIGTKDYKTVLQEKFQKLTKKCPVYELVNVSGPDHEQLFKVQVHLGNKIIGPCEGKSKKEAEQLCAKLAIEKLDSKAIKY